MKEDRWLENYELAKEYYEEHGNLKIPQSYTVDGIHLGIWIATQRQVYAGKRRGNLTQEKIHMLEDIDMIWQTEEGKKETWDTYYQEARKYYEEYGNLLVPLKFCSNGLNFGRWIDRQRQIKKGNEKGILTEAREKMLNDIGMCWEVKKTEKKSKRETTWENYYQEAKEYYETHGNLEVPALYEKNGIKLGNWITVQRRKETGKRQPALTMVQKEKLDQIGMQWGNQRKKTTQKQLEEWENYYQEAKKYYEAHGNLEVPVTYEAKGIKLGRWISLQRQRKKGTSLPKITQNEIEELNKIGMRWENIRSFNRRATGLTREQYRKKCMELIRKYHEEHGNVDVPQKYEAEGVQIGIWLDNVRRNRKKGGIPEWCIRELDELGMRWGNRNIMWEEGYQAAKKYYEEHGNLKVKYDFVTEDGIRLGNWIKRRRIAYKNGEMQQDQIDMLNEIHMIWRVWERKAQP